MRCGDIRPWLVQGLYEDMPEDRRVAVEAHLAACADCRRDRAGLSDVVGRWPRATAPNEAFFERQRRAIERRVATSRVRGPVWRPAAALALGAAALLVWVARPPRPPAESPMFLAQMEVVENVDWLNDWVEMDHAEGR